jgi:hypothetical protein
MANIEHEQNESSNGQDIVKILALYSLRKIDMEKLDSDCQLTLRVWYNAMLDDPGLKKLVDTEKEKLLAKPSAVEPVRQPDAVTKKEIYSQPSLLPTEPVSNNTENRLYKLSKDLNGQYYRHKKDTPIIEEIRHKRQELREKIGLTREEKKKAEVDPRLNKFLETRVCKKDIFHLFNEYDRVIIGEIPEELNLKINAVKDLIERLLYGKSYIFEKFNEFHKFEDEHREEWNIINYGRVLK